MVNTLLYRTSQHWQSSFAGEVAKSLSRCWIFLEDFSCWLGFDWQDCEWKWKYYSDCFPQLITKLLQSAAMCCERWPSTDWPATNIILPLLISVQHGIHFLVWNVKHHQTLPFPQFRTLLKLILDKNSYQKTNSSLRLWGSVCNHDHNSRYDAFYNSNKKYFTSGKGYCALVTDVLACKTNTVFMGFAGIWE